MVAAFPHYFSYEKNLESPEQCATNARSAIQEWSTHGCYVAFQECSTYNCYVSCNGRRGSDLRTKNGPLIVVMLDATVEVTGGVADFPHYF